MQALVALYEIPPVEEGDGDVDAAELGVAVGRAEDEGAGDGVTVPPVEPEPLVVGNVACALPPLQPAKAPIVQKPANAIR